jgi:ubiquinone/menaquinone biosynthesis C-methylase UbiE
MEKDENTEGLNSSQIFLNGEGDAWYQRNLDALSELVNNPASTDIHLISATLSPFKSHIHRILEVGTSSGAKLASLVNLFSSEGVGIDPSGMAIQRAQLEYRSRKELSFIVGVGEDLPFAAQDFDLVFLSFFLYLLPDAEARAAINEGTRVLKPGGFLAILDFDPGIPMRNDYKHLDGLFSWKRNYSRIVTEFDNFSLIAKKSYSHANEDFSFIRDKRISIEVFYKELSISE